MLITDERREEERYYLVIVLEDLPYELIALSDVWF
jgi:hypothetical protein